MSPADMRDLRLLTLNCWHGHTDPEAIASLIQERSVDVACFQELSPQQAAAVNEVLPHGKLEPSRDYNGLGIALRFPGEVQRLTLPKRDGRVVRGCRGEPQ